MTDARTLKMLLQEFDGNRQIAFSLQSRDNHLQVDFQLPADIGQTVWPAYDRLQRQDRLWESTCFELFLKDAVGPGYLEINLSPSGGWNVYAFTGYRQDMQVSNRLVVDSIMQETGRRLTALLSWQGTPMTRVQLNAACILEASTGQPAFFSIEHGTRPDFHDATCYRDADLGTL